MTMHLWSCNLLSKQASTLSLSDKASVLSVVDLILAIASLTGPKEH